MNLLNYELWEVCLVTAGAAFLAVIGGIAVALVAIAARTIYLEDHA